MVLQGHTVHTRQSAKTMRRARARSVTGREVNTRCHAELARKVKRARDGLNRRGGCKEGQRATVRAVPSTGARKRERLVVIATG